MKLAVSLSTVIVLIIAALSGFAAGCTASVPESGNDDTQLSELMFRISQIEQTVSTQQATISSQESEIASLESEMARLKMDLEESQSAQNWTEQEAALQSELASKRKQLDNILGKTVFQYYLWTYQRQPFQWTLSIPLSVYAEYLDKDRPDTLHKYITMAGDTADDLFINHMAQQIEDAASNDAPSEMYLTMVQKVSFVAAFVQSLPHTADNVTTPADDHPLYPLETLFNRGGDSEDTSILAAALLDAMGYDVALIYLGAANHTAVGVYLPGYHGSSYEYDGKAYYYLETTGDGWEIGQIPPSITYTTASVYPLRS